MKRTTSRTLSALIISVSAGIALIGPVHAADHVVAGPSGQPNPSAFATTDSGCLGQLRSLIAQGAFARVGPFGQHFTGTVDPGSHYGTVGEAAFLASVLGITHINAFCAQFQAHP